MISLLSHFFLKNESAMTEIQRHKAWGMISGLAGILLNLLLALTKFLAGLATGSIAVTADALNNLSDAASSIVTLIGFRLSSQEADPEHPFGHGRIEYLAGFIVSLLILLMAVELFRDSVLGLFESKPVHLTILTAAILLLSIAVKLYMFAYNRRIGRLTESATILAAATDSLSDVLATGVVLVSLVLTGLTGLSRIDAIAGIIVASFICKAGIDSIRDTSSPLLGQAPDPAMVKRIGEIVCSYPSIIGIHDLIIHNYGPGRIYVSLHAEAPANSRLLDIHDELDEAEDDIRREFGCETTIHVDPIILDDPEVRERTQQMLGILQEIDPCLSMHDFRIVHKKSKTRLVFDLLVPYGFHLSDEQVLTQIRERVRQQMGADLVCSIHIDRDFSADRQAQ
nr:cation diffusion facilitator family transporter [Shuttleworthia satelles]